MTNLTVNFTSAASMNFTATQQVNIMDIAVYSFNFLFGLPMHTYVIWLIFRGAGSGVASEFFNLSLSICEIGTCLNCVFFIMSNWFPGISSLAIFLIGLGITGRPLFQCLISVERYLAVVHPVTFLRFKPIRYKAICSIAVSIVTLGSCSVCMVTMSTLYIYTWFFLTQLLFYISIQLYFCLTVLIARHRSSSVSVSDLCRALPGGGSSCNLSEVQTSQIQSDLLLFGLDNHSWILFYLHGHIIVI